MNKHTAPHVAWFDEIDHDSIPLVGGKGANLGEMTKAKIPVPPGFCVTAPAYFYFLEANNLRDEIRSILKGVNINVGRSLNAARDKIQALILKAKIPEDLEQAIVEAYKKMPQKDQTLVAVRSSATAEDLPDASFAGQQATYLNIQGTKDVVRHVQKCWASLFESRAIFYREERGYDHFKVGIAVPVQKMVQSEVSGVMFTINPVNNDKTSIVVESIFGLGEMIVQGSATPDHFEIDRRNWRIIHKEVSDQDIELIKVNGITKERKIPESRIGKQKLEDKLIVKVAQIGEQLEKHYRWPQDVEWAFEDDKIYIVQTRPITTQDAVAKKVSIAETTVMAETKKAAILSGAAASPGVAVGTVKVLKSPDEIDKVLEGDILVAPMTTPDYVPAMKRAAAIVTDKGGQTSHAAIVSRELGVPCIVGTDKATAKLKMGQIITVDANKGNIYLGKIEIKHQKMSLPQGIKAITDIKTKTKVYVNLGEPELAFDTARKYVDGVGLLRAEFIISEYIGIHPKKLIKDGRGKFFTTKLAEGLEEFCRAFYPRPIIYRATDFKTNEYRELIGGDEYEPVEPNPMIGYRGCDRYIQDGEVFDLEMAAIKMVREKFAWKNLHVMIPFVRTVAEMKEIKEMMIKNDLKRTPNFKLFMMVEIPNTVYQLDDFIDVGIDGVSIGSNDLTMLIMGVDRDNEQVAHIYDIHDKGPLMALETICKTCKRRKILCSICGQAPSLYPDITEKLVKWGATSVSVSPDMVDKTRVIVYQVEQKLKKLRAAKETKKGKKSK
ncbi:phosphoenolpyruvate synthase [Candidatus Beckwithbacteria bacterium]|nr:phosphoenolpyruvate synthase [Candidatus Beckwithbacteria bacterium]